MFVLHIPSWYPDDSKPFTGNFIERHIEAIALKIPSVTLKVVETNQRTVTRTVEEVSPNNTVCTYYVTRKRSLLGRLFNKFLFGYYYIRGGQFIEQQFGKPSLLHLHVAFPRGSVAVQFKKKWKVPLLLTEHWSGYHARNYPLLPLKVKKELHKTWSHIDGITTVSEYLLNEIQERFPVSQSAIIYNVVDHHLFQPQPVSFPPIKLIHISTLDEDAKNFQGILEAVLEIRKKRNDFVLNIVSEFVKPQYEQWVVDHQLSDTVYFLGSKSSEEVAELLAQHHFLILYSNYENQPCVISEAFSCGKPVLSSDVGGIPEIISPDRGVIIAPQKTELLIAALEQFMDNFNRYNAENIREYAINHFSKEVIAEKFWQFYQKFTIFSQRDKKCRTQ